jgi:hypothetical protein
MGVRTGLTCIYESLFVATRDAADLLQGFLGNRVQLVSAQTTTGEEVFIVNLLDVLDCIDNSRSKLERYPQNYVQRHLAGRIRFVISLALRREVIENHHFFRISEENLMMFMSSHLLANLKDQNVQGIATNPVPAVSVR